MKKSTIINIHQKCSQGRLYSKNKKQQKHESLMTESFIKPHHQHLSKGNMISERPKKSKQSNHISIRPFLHRKANK